MNGHPYDDFYFTDFYTRIHRDDPMDGGTPKIAYCPEQARYNDGEYDLEARVTTVRDTVYKAEASFILDNYMPYIRAVTLTARQIGFVDPIVETTREWTCNGSCVSMYNPPPIEVTKAEWYAFLATPSVMVRAEASEPLGNLTLDLYQGTTTIANDIAAVQVDASEQVYIFDLSAYVGVLTGEVKMRFSGYDKSNNPLLDFSSASSSPSTSGCFSVPTRNSDTEWYNPDGVPNSGGDNTHAICIDCGPNFVSPNCVSIVLVDDGEECLAVSATVIDVSSPGQADGKVSLDISGGVPPYDIYWADGSSATGLHNLGPGQYCVTINDALCCEYQACFTVGGGCPDAPKPYISMAKVWAGSELIYEGKWTGSGCVSFVPNDGLPANQSTIHAIQQGAPIKIEATVNTALDWLVVSLPGTGASGLGAPIGTGDGRHWLFEFPSGVPNMAATPAGIEQPLSFTGAGAGSESEPLLDLLAMDDGSGGCITLPALQDDCNWLPPGQSGSDNVHIIVIEGCDGLAGPEGTLCPLIYPVQSCGAADGSIVFRGNCPFGGQYPLTYAWSNGTSTLNNYNLTGGLYTLTVTDGIGCQGVFDYFVPSFGAPMISQAYSADIDACAGLDNGYLEVGLVIDPNDNTPMDPLFEWSHGLVTSGDFVSIAEDLAPGEYCVTITNQATGCQTDACYTISALEPDGPLALAVDGISSSCYHSATGQAEIAITGGVMPYYRSNGQQVPGGTLSLSGLPAGEHCETITDHCGESVEVCFDVPVIESSNFDVQLSDLQHVSAPGANDGHAHIAVSPQGNYAYSWRPLSAGLSTATDEASGLSPGDYWVLVEDLESGCQRRLDFNIRECEEEEAGFRVVIQGGSALVEGQDIELYAIVTDPETGVELSGAQLDGFSFSWGEPGMSEYLLGYGQTLVLPYDYPHSSVKLRVTNGCSLRQPSKRILRCDTESGYQNALILNVEPPCQGSEDGAITFDLPTPDDMKVQLIVNGIEYPVAGVGEGGTAMFTVGGLGEGPQSITVIIGECEFSFYYDLSAELPDREYHSYDPSENLCYYTETSCDGEHTGEGEYYVREGEILWGGSLGNFWQACETPITCYGLNDEIVHNRSFSKVWMRSAEYLYVLNQALLNGAYPEWYIINLIETHIERDLWPCTRVRVCRENLRYAGRMNLAPFAVGEVTPLENGCERLQCGLVRITNCPEDVTEFYTLLDGEGPLAYSTCSPRRINIGHLYAHHEWLVNNVPEYANNSELRAFVELNGNDPRAMCATVTYCSSMENLKVLADNLDAVECGMAVYGCYSGPPAPLLLGYTCDPITYTEFGSMVLCSGNWSDPNCNFQPHQISNEPPEDIYCPTPCPIAFAPNDEERQLVQFQVFQDDWQHEAITTLGFSVVDGHSVPSGAVSFPDEGRRLFYDYDLHPGSTRIIKDSVPNVLHFIEDWNQEHLAVVQATGLGNELAVYKEDTTLAWLAYIDADIDLETISFEEGAGVFTLSGFFQGTLSFSGTAKAEAEERSLFQMKLSAEDGAFLGVDVLGTDNGEANVSFADKGKRTGSAILAVAQYRSPSLRLNDSEYTAMHAEGLALVSLPTGSSSVDVIADIAMGGSIEVLSSSFAEPGRALLVLGGQGTASIGSAAVRVAEDSLHFVMLNVTSGELEWHTAQPKEGLDMDGLDFRLDSEGLLLGGLTFTGTIAIWDTVFQSYGMEDILLFRLDNSGHLAWAEHYGTPESEQLSFLHPDKGMVHFAGHFTGSTEEKKIGEITFLNLFPTEQRAFMSYAFPYGAPGGSSTAMAAKPGGAAGSGLGKDAAEGLFEVYPNPFDDRLSVSVLSAEIASVAVIDLFGRKLHEAQIADTGHNFELDCSRYPSGSYFITFWDKDRSLAGTRKIIKK